MSIGQKLDSITELDYEELDKISEKSKFLIAPSTTSKYYYLTSTSVVLNGGSKVKYLIFATNSNNIIEAIFLFLPSISQETFLSIQEKIGNSSLTANSSMDYISTNSKSFWMLNSIRFLITQYGGNRSSKLSIVDTKTWDNEPSVFLFDN